MRNAFFVLTIVTLSLVGLIACSTEDAAEHPTSTPAATPVEEPTVTMAAPTEQPATAVPPIQAFEDQLMQALEQRDYGQLKGLMGDSFMIAGWRSEGTAYAPEGAVEQLQSNYLGQDTTLTFDPDKDLAALLDGMDPLSILGPDVRDPRAMSVSGWGLEGQDEAILYIAHDADGTPYWYGFLFSSGGFTQTAPGQVLDTDVEFVTAQQDVTMYSAPDAGAVVIGEVFDGQTARVTGVSADGGWWRVICPDDTVGDCWISADPGLTQPTMAPEGEAPLVLAIPEADMAVRLPADQMLMKNRELYRRGSFVSYDFVLPQDSSYPYLAEIQFFNKESIEGFLIRCAGAEHPCFFGDYPDLERYEGQKAAYARSEDYEGFRLQEFGGRNYFVSQHPCEGAPCIVREYTTFAGDTKVDVWVMLDGASGGPSQTAQADELFSQLAIQDNWAGIGAQPGPLYILLNPGVALRYPLGWSKNEESHAEGNFVVRSVSFVPPAFAASKQPQVPTIDLFVYDRPITDTLEAWLEAHSTDAPFGSPAGPEIHFFGVREIEPVHSASFMGLRLTHDVMGLTAHELLFAVGPKVVGLSRVDFGPEDLRPAYLQMQASLTAANTSAPAQATDVGAILATEDIAMVPFPDTAAQQIGQVMEGQVIRVTGVSEDGTWWRVICPNDTIGDCWLPADPLLTQPTTAPGAYPEPSARSTWIEYRDERYGYGVAVPCHWVFLPPPPEGNFATLTVRSYDDAFFMQNSVKGQWRDGQWPGGAMKMDLTVVEGVPPGQSLAGFVGDLLQQSESTELERVEEVQIGSQQAVAAVTVRSDNPSDRHTTFAFRLAPDKVLLMSVSPEDAWRSGDAQGIVGSVALSDAEPVTMPEYPPGAPIIAVPEGCGR